MDTDDLTRQWLRENGYADIATMIEKIMDDWKASGKKTREIGGKCWQYLTLAIFHVEFGEVIETTNNKAGAGITVR